MFISKSIYRGYYKTKYMAMAGLLAAVITVTTAYLGHIPIGINGGYIHMGDAFVYLAAALLPKPYALLAAAVGAGLADLLTAPAWVPATVIIKMLLVLLFSNRKKKTVNITNIMSTIAAIPVSCIGYYIAEVLLFEQGAVFWVSVAQTAVQSGGSAVVFILVGETLDKMRFKERFL